MLRIIRRFLGNEYRSTGSEMINNSDGSLVNLNLR
jgi:hypothetical protein